VGAFFFCPVAFFTCLSSFCHVMFLSFLFLVSRPTGSCNHPYHLVSPLVGLLAEMSVSAGGFQ
jgi:hypothetical protein